MIFFFFIVYFIYCFINKNFLIYKVYFELIYLLVLIMMKNLRLILFFIFYIGCYFVLFLFIFINCNELFVKGEERLCFFFIFLRLRIVLLRFIV